MQRFPDTSLEPDTLPDGFRQGPRLSKHRRNARDIRNISKRKAGDLCRADGKSKRCKRDELQPATAFGSALRSQLKVLSTSVAVALTAAIASGGMASAESYSAKTLQGLPDQGLLNEGRVELVQSQSQVSVERIFAQQLARRFRDMSNDELVDVFEQLLQAQRASSAAPSLQGSAPPPLGFRTGDDSKARSRREAEAPAATSGAAALPHSREGPRVGSVPAGAIEGGEQQGEHQVRPGTEEAQATSSGGAAAHPQGDGGGSVERGRLGAGGDDDNDTWTARPLPPAPTGSAPAAAAADGRGGGGGGQSASSSPTSGVAEGRPAAPGAASAADTRQAAAGSNDGSTGALPASQGTPSALTAAAAGQGFLQQLFPGGPIRSWQDRVVAAARGFGAAVAVLLLSLAVRLVVVTVGWGWRLLRGGGGPQGDEDEDGGKGAGGGGGVGTGGGPTAPTAAAGGGLFRAQAPGGAGKAGGGGTGAGAGAGVGSVAAGLGRELLRRVRGGGRVAAPQEGLPPEDRAGAGQAQPAQSFSGSGLGSGSGSGSGLGSGSGNSLRKEGTGVAGAGAGAASAAAGGGDRRAPFVYGADPAVAARRRAAAPSDATASTGGRPAATAGRPEKAFRRSVDVGDGKEDLFWLGATSGGSGREPAGGSLVPGASSSPSYSPATGPPAGLEGVAAGAALAAPAPPPGPSSDAEQARRPIEQPLASERGRSGRRDGDVAAQLGRQMGALAGRDDAPLRDTRPLTQLSSGSSSWAWPGTPLRNKGAARGPVAVGHSWQDGHGRQVRGLEMAAGQPGGEREGLLASASARTSTRGAAAMLFAEEGVEPLPALRETPQSRAAVSHAAAAAAPIGSGTAAVTGHLAAPPGGGRGRGAHAPPAANGQMAAAVVPLFYAYGHPSGALSFDPWSAAGLGGEIKVQGWDRDTSSSAAAASASFGDALDGWQQRRRGQGQDEHDFGFDWTAAIQLSRQRAAANAANSSPPAHDEDGKETALFCASAPAQVAPARPPRMPSRDGGYGGAAARAGMGAGRGETATDARRLNRFEHRGTLWIRDCDGPSSWKEQHEGGEGGRYHRQEKDVEGTCFRATSQGPSSHRSDETDYNLPRRGMWPVQTVQPDLERLAPI
eukprot:jgi/Mesen1/10870/ME000093S10394